MEDEIKEILEYYDFCKKSYLKEIGGVEYITFPVKFVDVLFVEIFRLDLVAQMNNLKKEK